MRSTRGCSRRWAERRRPAGAARGLLPAAARGVPLGAAAALTLLVAASCRTPPGAGAPGQQLPTLVGTAWQAEEVAGVRGPVKPTLRFAREGRVTGNAGCNLYNGTVTEVGGVIRFGPLTTTRRACAEAVMELEQRFVAAVAATRAIRADGSRLVFTDEGGAPRLRLLRLDDR